jgi:hypothetical protein
MCELYGGDSDEYVLQNAMPHSLLEIYRRFGEKNDKGVSS